MDEMKKANEKASRPTRARGLKLIIFNRIKYGAHVAPHAGAWIETPRRFTRSIDCVSSRPTRARGLKHNEILRSISRTSVAPHAGAWIETSLILEISS